MGRLCLEIVRRSETATHAIYDFASQFEDKTQGSFEIAKSTGELTLLSGQGSMLEQAFLAAGSKLRAHWKSGEFPTRTAFAG